MLQLKTIRFKNFLSYGNSFTEIRLDRHPTLLFLGSNGNGKSVLLDAITFALFGKAYRQVNKGQLVNTVNRGECVVEIEFTVHGNTYLIRRGIKPAIFEIFENGKLMPQKASSTDTQNDFETNILKVTYETFTQVVILGVANYTPLMKLSTTKRREFIEDILDIEVFSSMNELLKGRVSEVKTSLATLNTKITSTTEQIQLVEEFISKLATDQQKKLDDAHKKIEDSLAFITGLESEIAPLQELLVEHTEHISDAPKVQKRLDKLRQHEYEIRSKLKALKTKLSFYATNDKCNQCGQVIHDEYKNEVTQKKSSETKELQDAIKSITDKITVLEERQSAITSIQKEINTLERQIAWKQNQINGTRHYVEKLQSDISADDGNVENENNKLLKLQEKLKQFESDKEEAVHKKHLHDIAGLLLKDTGIKSEIIKQYIPVINSLVNKYLKMMNLFVSFTLDHNFEETFKSRYRDVLSYNSFSNGERLRCDLALLFTFREIASRKNSCATNLLILDEIIDSSLDLTGTEDFIKILYELGETANVIVISHKSEHIIDKFSGVMRFEKVGNFSRIVGDAA